MPNLIVPAGTTLTIDESYRVEPVYDLFRMELNSTIITEIDLQIVALRAEFVGKCLIDGSGRDGNRGADRSKSPDRPASQCQDGHNGANGGTGAHGSNGRNIRISAGLAKVGELKVRSNGGNGGDGGNGQPGQQGGGALCLRCNGGAGGDGGRGGPGGNGGNGGRINVKWTPIPSVDVVIGKRRVIPLDYFWSPLLDGRSKSKGGGPGYFGPTPLGHSYEALKGQGGKGGASAGGGRGGDGVGCFPGSAQGGGPRGQRVRPFGGGVPGMPGQVRVE